MTATASADPPLPDAQAVARWPVAEPEQDDEQWHDEEEHEPVERLEPLHARVAVVLDQLVGDERPAEVEDHH